MVDVVEHLKTISIHALLAESDVAFVCFLLGLLQFLSTLSLRRATFSPRAFAPVCLISIHALLAESDRPQPVSDRQSDDFYPRSPCGERLQDGGRIVVMVDISIHALLAESDCS